MTQRSIRLSTLVLPLVLIGGLPAQAQTAAGPQPPAEASPPAAEERSRALEPADLLPHLDEIRRQHPRLYDRLRRMHPPPAEAMAARPPRSVEGLLRQDVGAALRKQPAEPQAAP